jgi:hypothetical protein
MPFDTALFLDIVQQEGAKIEGFDLVGDEKFVYLLSPTSQKAQVSLGTDELTTGQLALALKCLGMPELREVLVRISQQRDDAFYGNG